ncbi:MAG: integral rane sensor signal transduction histidine kinase, partial [Steroidobacteraceae bacterium]|nr:integral rane sensor signal transduction histidine kinase [Steroidobacteraceae bacterium]
MTDAAISRRPWSAGGVLRGTCVRNVAGAAIGGLLIATIEFALTRGTVQFDPVEQGLWLVRLSLHWSLAALPLGLAFTWVERRRAGSGPSRLGYVLAVLTGAAVGAVIVALHGKYADPAIAQTAVGLDLPLEDRFLYGLWQLSFWGTVGAFLHAAELQRRRGVLSLQQGELARLHGEMRLADARLAALHAQVEPEFLLATLDTVERLYARDVTAADAVLDALIQFLREATPLLRGGSSTLPQECRLLQLYLDIPGGPQAASTEHQVDVPPTLRCGL